MADERTLIRQRQTLKELTEVQVDHIAELRFIMSRLSGDLATANQRQQEAYVFMAQLVDALRFAVEFIEECETEITDIIGDDGYSELIKNVKVVEAING